MVDEIAFGIHVGLALGHGVSAFYNRSIAKRIDGWVVFHSVAGLLDLYAAGKHLQRVKAME